jgi:hypothetical protein
MKLTCKKILAGAVGAGLLTFTAGSARALVVGDDEATVLDAQLIVKYTDDNGKVKRATITSKDLLIAIGEDQEDNADFYKGDDIIAYDRDDVPDDAGSYDYAISDKDGDDIFDLSDADVIFTDYETLTESDHESDDSYKYVETGIMDFEFYSDGDPESEEDNELSFDTDFSTPYTYTLTETAINHHSDKFTETITEKDGIDTDGFDFDVFDNGDDPLPIAGVITQDGSGKIDE